MKKQVFLGYWFYLFGMTIAISLSICMIVLEVWQLITIPPEENSTITALYWGLPISILVLITLIYLMGYCSLQFIILSENGIKARCLWFTLRELKWEEVKEIRYERLNVSVQGGFTSGWFVFDDGIERKQIGNGSVLRKNANQITLHASKRARRAIEYFTDKPIVEMYI